MSQENKRSLKKGKNLNKADKDQIKRNRTKFANNGLMNIKKKENRYGGVNALGMHISEGWHTITNDIDDIESYILNYLSNPEFKYDVIKIWIGTDSVRKTVKKGVHEVRLLSVICLRREGKGVHIVKRRESPIFQRFVPTGEKLNMEVNKTYEMAMWMRELGFEPEVHLDLNPNESFESFNVYKEIQGWFESMGFKAEYKPDAAGAMCGADYYL